MGGRERKHRRNNWRSVAKLDEHAISFFFKKLDVSGNLINQINFFKVCLKIVGIVLREKLCSQRSFQWRVKKPATLNLPISVGALAAFCFSFPIFHPDSWKIKTSGRTIADTTETSDSKSFKASKPGIANSLGNPDPHPSCLCQPFVEVPHTSLKCIFDEYRFFNYVLSQTSQTFYIVKHEVYNYLETLTCMLLYCLSRSPATKWIPSRTLVVRKFSSSSQITSSSSRLRLAPTFEKIQFNTYTHYDQ